MVYMNLDIRILQRQFYDKTVSFNNFRNITKESIESILTKIKLRAKRAQESESRYTNNSLNNYIKTLQYLINPKIGLELKTIDERLLYLILSVDPDFKMFEAFLESDIIPESDIKSASAEEQPALQQKRKTSITSFSDRVRDEIGFYDPNLLKYESALKKGLLKEKGFFSKVRIPTISSLIRKADKVANLDVISDLNLGRIKYLIQKWYTEAKDPQDLNSLAYNIINNRELHLFVPEEQVLFFTLIADPDLSLLTIYEEECTIDKIKARAQREVGFITKGMLNIERLYHDKFEPEKQISAWTK